MENQQYSTGIYVRYDWRNPNHIIRSNPSLLINADPFYYIIESHFQKEEFFSQILSKKCEAVGDKCITPDVLDNYVDIKKVNTVMLQLFCTMSYYLAEVKL